MMPMTVYTADVAGRENNAHYPRQHLVVTAADLQAVARLDHVVARYTGGKRSNAGFICADCLVMDVDNDHTDTPEQWITPDGLADTLPGVRFMTATSRNHMKRKASQSARPRFHAYFPIAEVKDARAYAALKKQLATRFGFFDPNAVDASRFIYGHPSPETTAYNGDVSIDTWLTDAGHTDVFAAFDAATQAIGEGHRNATLSRFAGRVLIRYGDSKQARGLFDRKAALCDPPLPQKEIETIWASAKRFAAKIAEEPEYVSPETYKTLSSLIPDDFTDIGQASLMAMNYLDRVRYSPATKWLAYSGGVWNENEPLAHRVFQELTERQLSQAREQTAQLETQATKIEQVAGATDADDTAAMVRVISAKERLKSEAEHAQAFMLFVKKRRSSKAIRDTMKETQPLVLINPDELDHNPYLLCTPCGTLDLRYGVGSLRTNQPEDLITRQTSISPTHIGMERWMDALALIFQGDSELIGYVQRICGLAAIGKVMVEALIIAYGNGSNGKSTFWNTIARVLGSYAASINAEVLVAGKKNSAKNDMAETRGRRLLIAAETEEGKRLSTASAKQLASTDKIAAEKKYKDPFSFTPSHTLVLYTNHLPKVGAMDRGIWRRLIVVPFEAKIEGNKDVKNYGSVLYEKAGGAALSWIIEGARLIHAENYKLTPPSCVIEATEAYRESNNWFAHFLEDCCEIGSDFEQASGALYQAYRAWALSTGEYVRSTRDFYTTIEHCGFNRRRTNRGWFIRGLTLTAQFL